MSYMSPLITVVSAPSLSFMTKKFLDIFSISAGHTVGKLDNHDKLKDANFTILIKMATTIYNTFSL